MISSALMACALFYMASGTIDLGKSQKPLSIQTGPDLGTCLRGCAHREAACSNQCRLALLSNRISKIEYQACADHCVTDYMKCSSACRENDEPAE
jgi:hypothetical protein